MYINLYLASPFSVSKETHPLCYLQTEVGCLTFLLDRKHIPSATCRRNLAVLPSCWPGTHIQSAICREKLAVLPSYWPWNTSPLLLSNRSWLPYLPVGQETHPLCYLQTEVGCLTFLLARKHIPSATCRQKLASFALDSCPSSHEGRRMLKSSPTNQLIFNKKTFQLKINRPRDMVPEITPSPQKGHWTWNSTGYSLQADGTHPTGMHS